MTIAVDFDGTIVEDRYPMIGKPVPYAFETLLSLQKKGHKIILWTVREGKALDEAVEFCRSSGLEFYAVNCETPAGWESPVLSPRKLRADIYIDDRGIAGLPDWPVIGMIIRGEIVPDGRRFDKYRSSRNRSSDIRNIFKKVSDRCRRSRERFGRR